MANRAEDMYIEADGRRIWMGHIQSDGTGVVQIPALSVVHAAIVQGQGDEEVMQITVASGGIGMSGDNYVSVQYWNTSGQGQTSGLSISGDYLQVIAAGA